jgi:hypothetical protein
MTKPKTRKVSLYGYWYHFKHDIKPHWFLQTGPRNLMRKKSRLCVNYAVPSDIFPVFRGTLPAPRVTVTGRGRQ